MSLNETAVYTTSLDWWVANARHLERQLITTLERLSAVESELARFEPVVVSTGPVPRTLSFKRADGSRDWVDHGIDVYLKVEAEQ